MAIIKEKYSLSNLYEDNSSSLYVLRKRVINDHKVNVKIPIGYIEFRDVIYAYFKIKLSELMRFGFEKDIEVSLISGLFCLRKNLQTRSFHTIKDNEESAKQGKLVKKRIPVLDDYFARILWMNKKIAFGRLRVKFGKAPTLAKKELVKKYGYDSFKMEEKKKDRPNYVKK